MTVSHAADSNYTDTNHFEFSFIPTRGLKTDTHPADLQRSSAVSETFQTNYIRFSNFSKSLSEHRHLEKCFVSVRLSDRPILLEKCGQGFLRVRLISLELLTNRPP